MDIGERIRERRESLGMTQSELARAVGYTSRSTINSRFENSAIFAPNLPLQTNEKTANT